MASGATRSVAKQVTEATSQATRARYREVTGTRHAPAAAVYTAIQAKGSGSLYCTAADNKNSPAIARSSHFQTATPATRAYG